ncbi:VOC family protein [Pseudonocardia sp. RS11V-5]|uniref:VOC family protein n=1 Tax=Pseudonocardia terrae TaxID=2905831 RepID=UPI001E31145C|nr:VOC family protein [Pseudonocardia terrae]MCE3552891.1 VOC family protein [Pseudonocardia terrae]
MTVPTTPPARVGNVQYPVADVAAATDFYRMAFGFSPRFVDGSRYAVLETGGVALALAGAEEDVTGGRVAASCKVPEVAVAVRAVVVAGGSVLQDIQQGPHELRAVVADPWGNAVVVYGPN